MDKRTFKSRMLRILEEDVEGLSYEKKIKYMKKWIREYEEKKMAKQIPEPEEIQNSQEEDVKIGLLVRTTLNKLVRGQLLSPEKIRLLQDERFCKSTFDINYPFLKKAEKGNLAEQRKINGYDRYWADVIRINHESYFICNDWYERNRSKFVMWVMDLEINS